MAEIKKAVVDKEKTPSRPPSIAENALIVRPIITEKSTDARERLQKYTFEVIEQATKRGVQNAVEKLFNVKVQKVNIVRRHGKRRVVRAKPGWTKDRKRAVVTVAPGQKITFFEGI